MLFISFEGATTQSDKSTSQSEYNFLKVIYLSYT